MAVDVADVQNRDPIGLPPSEYALVSFGRANVLDGLVQPENAARFALGVASMPGPV